MGLISYLSSGLSTLSTFFFSGSNQAAQRNSTEQKTERTFAEYMREQRTEAISKAKRVSDVLTEAAINHCNRYALAELGYTAMVDPYFGNDEKRWNGLFQALEDNIARSLWEVTDCIEAIGNYYQLKTGTPRDELEPCSEPIEFEDFNEDSTDPIRELIFKVPYRTPYCILIRKHHYSVSDKIKDKIGYQPLIISPEMQKFTFHKVTEVFLRVIEEIRAEKCKEKFGVF
ncbi:hypothetical protein PNK_p0041 (plasmid) [Candidatus Protochlamydia naegleriophila]|uniref:Uncharacterized protein n=1 Tax=Candidatus Protochlamydia naegleriophila TaxID=389348 RepID=A0A0U5JI35_9BACT|nr:hypothetical protein [Candidatus Protochlamydia naegleriophila]CUI18095.1 hypothetical protein PNK_p0041 [Candidatus Protochlamydia naegleriophila]